MAEATATDGSAAEPISVTNMGGSQPSDDDKQQQETNAEQEGATKTAATSSGGSTMMAGLKELKDKWNALEPKWRWTAYGTLAVVLIVIIVVAATSGGGGDNNNDKATPPPDITGVDLTALELNENSTEVPKTFLEVALEMVEISRNVYNGPNQTVPGATRYEDDVDAALWVKQGDLCILAFQATTAMIRDWYQNIPIRGPVTITSPTGKKCMTQKGFRDAYYDVNYFEQLEEDVRGCVDSCEGGCDLIITGGSQGAAIAAVAAVDLEDLAPKLITFGQPASLFDVEGEPPCSEAVPMERFIRFINTRSSFLNTIPLFQDPADVTVLQYDPVPVLPARFNSTDHHGSLILIGDPTTSPLAFYPEGKRELVPPSLVGDFDTHIMKTYIARLKAILEVFGNDPVPLVGFPDGGLCNFDSECQSTSLCFNLTCVPESDVPQEPLEEKLDEGERCFRDTDCETDACVVTCRDEEYRWACSPSSKFFDVSDCVGLLENLDIPIDIPLLPFV